MGVAFCAVFKKDVPPYGKLGGDNIALTKGYEKLDAVAEKHGLRTLGSFLSTDAAAAAEMFEIDTTDMDLPPEEWFKAADGLAALRALIDHLRDHPKAIAKAADMLSELKEVEKELTAAQRQKVAFHFEIVP